MNHLNDLVLDMGCLLAACHFNSQLGSANQDVAYTNLAAAIGLSVVACEALNDHAGKFYLAIEEDHVIRNEYTVEDRC